MHRISKAHLQKPKEVGGLALPNFRQYYWAANMRAMMLWRDCDRMAVDQLDIYLKWLYMEARSVDNSSLAAILWSKSISRQKIQCNNVIVLNSIKILNQIKTVLKIEHPSIYLPICNNHDFFFTRTT